MAKPAKKFFLYAAREEQATRIHASGVWLMNLVTFADFIVDKVQETSFDTRVILKCP